MFYSPIAIQDEQDDEIVLYTIGLGVSAPVITDISPASNPPGAIVSLVITGTGFTPASTVSITGSGAILGTPVYVSPTEIDVTLTLSSLATGTYNITVTTIGGTSNADTFTVIPTPLSAPVIDSIDKDQFISDATKPLVYEDLLILGSYFLGSSPSLVFPAGFTVSNLVVASTSLTFDLEIAPSTTPDTYTFYFTASNGDSNEVTFTIQETRLEEIIGRQTAMRFITRCMRTTNIIDQTEDPDPDEALDALDTWNEMLELWNREGLMMPDVTMRDVVSLSTLVQDYAIGLLYGDFLIQRPDHIDRAAIIDSNGIEIPIRVYNNSSEWADVLMKGILSSELPYGLYYNATFPLGAISIFPTPSRVISLVLYTRGRLQRINSLATQIYMPDGYMKTMRYNLTVELALAAGVPIQQRIIDLANESRGILKAANMHPSVLKIDPGLLGYTHGVYDINSDTYR